MISNFLRFLNCKAYNLTGAINKLFRVLKENFHLNKKSIRTRNISTNDPTFLKDMRMFKKMLSQFLWFDVK